ncbi:beta-lactamase family protein [Muricauda sp. 2012CJ35-5]|uniref:Beta-lactamase family protein n=1 Tax=Flagellimonas spongiicola TaxID=2942208 RepID=A0ABT0PW57_9FLAO|nr:serine hydrolase domain-containing protein [Allomuricauda spongiicola]MCL6275421.1 beta-lactamase family protein [Allomuricauda spongiicola]
MIQKVIFTLFVGLLVQLSCAQTRPQKPAIPFESIEAAHSFLKQQEAVKLFSGTVLVVHKGKELMREAYGMANVEKSIKNNTNTKINLGSINKAFTAVSVMQLVDAGKLKLSDKVVTYIPELNADMADEITIMQLLEMKSGLGSYWDSELFWAKRNELNSMEDYLPIINEYPLNSKPGTIRAYSNSGYELLGIVVQRVSGQNYFDYVREHIYQKANMSNTDAFTKYAKVENRAIGYSKYKNGESIGGPDSGQNKPFKFSITDRMPLHGTAAGGGYSTLDDMRNFVESLTSNRLLSKESTARVLNHFRDGTIRPKFYSVRGGSYGINSTVNYDMEKDLLVIIMSNYDPPTASEVMRRLRITPTAQG